MKLQVSTLAVLLGMTGIAQAHHSFAPHFDINKPVNLTGVITEFEQRNPHAYLHMRAQDADGRTAEWRCETHGVTQLTRNGITPDMLKPGTELRITGSQHRRDEHECFFDTAYFPDGRILSVNGPRVDQTALPKVAPRDSFYGVWLLAPANRPTSGPQFMMDFLTDAGKAAVAKYDPFTMDPTYRCEPVGIRRGWFAPGTPMAIRKDGKNIVIAHEWMDIKRTVHMNEAAAPANTAETILGYSRGHFDGNTLVVETDHYQPGVINQFVEVKGQPMRGQLHSNALRTVERIQFDKASNRIKLAIETYDPLFFTRDFPLGEAEFAASDLEIKPFGCMPEQLK
ncbi:MAG: DUF6152 family protein [Gammaproteobacteria bacterium]|jgi:hypothetical protein